jgi:F-type H+-transporting ATPase subunit gamma
MAKARAIIKRRQAVQNIRKITRTMELIATARFRKALDRAVQAEAFTRKVAELVADLGQDGGADGAAGVSHPLLAVREPARNAVLLVLTSNRGLAGGYNANVLRAGFRQYQDFQTDGVGTTLEVSGKRGIGYMRFRGVTPASTYTTFEDKPQFDEILPLAERYIALYTSGQIDRLDVAYTKFHTIARQEAVVETLLPMTAASVAELGTSVRKPAAPTPAASAAAPKAAERVPYEFLPDATSILTDLVPISFKVRLFKTFLDAAVSEQIARRVAMKGATDNADDMVKSLTRLYNRARQSQITRELSEIIGGAAALE